MAIVTGASRGLGREVVLELTRRGVPVIVVYLHDQAAAEAVVDGVYGAGGTALAVRADVTDGLDVERLFDETIAAFGVVDVVVHAARRDPRELLEQALHRLRPGGAVLTTSASRAPAPALVERLRARGVTVTELGDGREPSSRGDEAGRRAELLRPWLDGPGRAAGDGAQRSG